MLRMGRYAKVFDLFNPGFWVYMIRFNLAKYYENRGAMKKLRIKNGTVVNVSVSFREPHNIFMGDNVSIGADCRIWPGGGKISIGDNVLFGPGVCIFASNHGSLLKSGLIMNQPSTPKNVTIEADCWLGGNSIILPGVTVGSGTVVAAGTVVTSNTPGNCIVAGVPSKVISYRK